MNIPAIIKKQKDHNKLSHLYIVIGPKGSIRDEVLKSMLEIILDEHFDQLETMYQHTRCVHIAPEQTIIKKDQVLSLQEEFSKTSLSKGYRAFVIEDIDQLNQASSNSLLKFLEEPSGHKTIGILFTNKPQAVLDTIKSRAQIFYLPRPETLEIKQHLMSLAFDEALIDYVLVYTQDLKQIENLLEQPYIKETVGLFEKTMMLMSETKYEQKKPLDSSVLSVDMLYFEWFIALLYQAYLDMLSDDHFIKFKHLTPYYNQIKTYQTPKVMMTFMEALQKIQFESRYFVSLDLLRRKLMHTIEDHL
jgi:DNA polymerase-3 subunit delta'